ncbi:Foldase protein PrsA 3 precursor [compost metagenome]
MQYSTRKSVWRRSAMIVVAALLVMTIAACGAKATEIATYKGGSVTDKEFDKYLKVFNVLQPGYEQLLEIPQFKEELLRQYVSYKIVGSLASDEAKKEAKDNVKEQMDLYKETLKENKDLKATIEDKKIKNKDMENYMMLTSLVVAHMNSKVTDEEMRAELEENLADYTTVTLRHILVATTTTDPATQQPKELRTAEEALARANEVKAKLEAGGDWAELAKEYSDDPGSSETGGLYEDKKAGGWVGEFKQAAYTQEIGVIGNPVETEFGYHVILVEKRTIPTFETLSESDKELVKNTAAYGHMDTFMKDEFPTYDVVINLPVAEEETPASDTPASDAPAGDEGTADDAAPADDAAATETPAAK